MKVLILSPHTDDAELGCGGTIIKFVERGDEIKWMVFSTAEESLPNDFPRDALKTEFIKVVSDLSLTSRNYIIYNYQVRNLHRYRQEILDDLIITKNTFEPELVIGPSINDIHQDHQIVANEMIRAFKNSAAIISYELPWNHIAFNTQCFCKLSATHIEKKWKLLNNYKSQFTKEKQYFTRDYIYGVAKTRGVQCNSEYAEAFEVTRWMI